jgi:hypothetical protein
MIALQQISLIRGKRRSEPAVVGAPQPTRRTKKSKKEKNQYEIHSNIPKPLA